MKLETAAKEANEWGSAVECRWTEICAHLDLHIEAGGKYPADTIAGMMGELNALYVVTQYAGSNARTGWLMAMVEYRASRTAGAAEGAK